MQQDSQHLGNYYVPLESQNGVCVDIGGNTAMFSLKYKDFFKLIHIYEPQKECCKIIEQKIKGKKNIKLFDEAVYNTSNLFVNLISHSSFDNGSVALKSDIIVENEWLLNVVVEKNCKTISLEDIIQRIGGYIDYMKVDCENSEYHLLMDKDLSKIKYMGIELHWQMGKNNFDKLVNHILKFFNCQSDLTYPQGYNIEVFFISKFIHDYSL